MSRLSTGVELVRETIAGAEEISLSTIAQLGWPELDFSLPGADKAPAPELRLDSLPSEIMDWFQATASACAAPLDYVVANLLAFASGWLGNARHIRATPTWIEPPHLWFACVGAPSTGKTPALLPFVKVSHELEADNEQAWKETLAAYERDAEHAKARADLWKKEVRAAVEAGNRDPDMPLDAISPEAPIRPRVIIFDVTVQEIGNILGGNPRGLVQSRDELSGWLGSMDQFSGGSSDRAFYLESWNGGSHTIDRVKHAGQPVRVRYCSLAIIGGLQPDKLKEALDGADDGLAARLGFVWPDPPPYRDVNNKHDHDAVCRAEKLVSVARRLRSLTMERNDRGELLPVVLPIDEHGVTLLNEMRRDATARARAAHGLGAGWHGKAPAKVLRLALVIEHLTWAMSDGTANPPTSVSAESVVFACNYVDYLGEMFERVIGGLMIDGIESGAAAVARVLVKERPDTINERDFYQRPGLSFLREASVRRKIFAALTEAGFIRPAAKTGKGRRRGDWDVNPRIIELAA
jgi:hypothetical protein